MTDPADYAVDADYVRALFGTEEADEPPAEPTTPPNYVAREGNNPQPGPDDDMRTFAAELFARAHND